MRSYSYSQINRWVNCPLSWKYAKIDKLPQIESVNLIQGRILHEKVDEYIRHLVKNNLTSDITWSGLSDGLDNLPEGVELMDRFARSFVLNPESHYASELEIAITKEGFSNRGDSGSLVLDMEGYAVGKLFAGNLVDITYANQIQTYLDLLEAELIIE